MLSNIPLRALSVLVFSLILFSGFARTAFAPTGAGPDMSRLLVNRTFAALPGESAQLLVATGDTPGSGPITVHILEKDRDRWVTPFQPINAVIGRNGFAGPGAKREGDGKTPSGIYPLTLAFGYAANIDTRMPYRMATEDDVWVDDPGSPDYNRWVKRKDTLAGSFEELRRRDNLYRHSLVIGYNMEPVVRGHGSAIFLHIWKGRNSPTSGCVAMAERDLLRILQWLDPAKKPLIVMGARETVLKLTE